MGIENSELLEDIVGIINKRSTTSDTRFKYSLDIIANDSTVSVLKVHTLDITRDFVSRYGDYMILAVSINRLEYDALIYPNREDLTATLTVESVHDKTGIAGGDKAVSRYRVKLTDAVDDGLVYGDTTATSDSEKSQEIKDVTIQLMDLNLEKLRLKDITGIIRDTKVLDLLNVVMSDRGEYSVDVYPPDKINNITQLVVGGQESIAIADFPSWLQKYGGGVYNHNIGFYCYNGWVYVYPLFKVDRDPKRRKLVLCSVGPTQLMGIDNTYSVEPGKLSIISSGKVEMEDTTDKLTYNLGNGVKFNIPNFLRDGVTHDSGVTTVTGSGLRTHGINNEVLNNVKSYKLITNNPFYEISRVNSNRGIRASFTWENANPSLIYPNMEVTVLYKTGDTTHSLKGIVIGMDYQSSIGENEATNPTHTGNAILHLFLDKNVI
ncbi:hypothetical protein TSMG0171 [Halocynthia phage JM-2012]|uniref:hypothetical protein n=1 Tax=Halocynthia phage JM-2012 TaxID=1173297 RepID=UPI00025C698D|nr:hypothetical protein TSMG0171 [Halocynthia phage JM-2012]AFI55454.1 hypothetical protein TSMG0171 [Halocynthia phage JM-2012]